MTKPPRYVDLKVPALREKCDEYGLDCGGNRRDIVERLERKDRMTEATDRGDRLMELERFRSREGGSQQGDQGRNYEAPSRQIRAESDRNLNQQRDGLEFTRSAYVFPNDVTRRDLPFRRHYEDPHPRTERSITDLSEVDLEDILFANYMPPQTEGSGFQRRMKIKAEHDVKVAEARLKKDTAIKRLDTKYSTEVEKLRVEREEKLVELDRELGPKQEKSIRWKPAFARLRALREARNLPTIPRDFAPRPASQSIQPYRSAPLPVSSHPYRNPRPISPPRLSFSAAALPPILKRKATSPLRSQYQAQEPRAQGQGTNRSQEPLDPQPPANKRSCSDCTRPLPAAPTRFLPISTSTASDAGNLAYTLTESAPLAPKLMHRPYIFFPSTVSFKEINILLAECPHTPGNLQIRADTTGVFVLFEYSTAGEEIAERCYRSIDWADDEGKYVGMKLHITEREMRGSPMS